MNPPRFWLQRIELNNYRCFKQLTVDFDERLTVLVARNGLGKTAVLDAISVALGTFVGSFFSGKLGRIEPADVRLVMSKPELHEMEPQYPVSIEVEAEIDIEGNISGDIKKMLDVIKTDEKYSNIRWIRNLNSPKSKTTNSEVWLKGNREKKRSIINTAKMARYPHYIGKIMQILVTGNQCVTLPLVVYYGTGRLWKQKNRTQKRDLKSEFFSRTSGYQDCLDPASSFKYVEDWLKYATDADNEERNLRREKQNIEIIETDTAFTPLLAAVRLAVEECLKSTGWQGLRYSYKQKTVVMEHPDYGVLEVSQLSDGVRNMIGLVADIAYRTVRLNSRFGQEAPKQTPGLVLIDEVDMHLHPEWQQIVLTSLTKAFPALQFIVTTHSPQVLTTVPAKSIRVLDTEWDEETGCNNIVVKLESQETLGMASSDVMAETMGTDPVPDVEPARQLSRYKALIQQNIHELNEGQGLRTQLDQHFGPQHPLMLECDRMIRLQSFKRQLPQRG